MDYDKNMQKVGGLFLLDSDQIMYQIRGQSKSDRYQCIQKADFTEHELDELMVDWTRTHLSVKAVTFNDVIFQANSDNDQLPKAAKTFFWNEQIHTDA